MNKSAFYFSWIMILLQANNSFDQINYLKPPIIENPFSVDSLNVGIGFLVIDNNLPVTISWKYRKSNSCEGRLYYCRKDSAIILFHNFIENYPQELNSVEIGKFPQGESIYLKYVQDSINSGCIGEILYSGQNRTEYDQYVSYIPSNTLYPNRRIAGGRIPNGNVEAGFDDQDRFAFVSIIFQISNVFMEGVEKYKLPFPRCSNTIIQNKPTISISIPDAKRIFIEIVNEKYDTTITEKPQDEIEIYYTTDSTNPATSSTRTLYSSPITIDKTTTIKACAVPIDDTLWVRSEIVTETFTINNSTVRMNRFPSRLVSQLNDCIVYALNGRHLYSLHATDAQITAYTSSLPMGIYFLRFKGTADAKRVVVSR